MRAILALPLLALFLTACTLEPSPELPIVPSESPPVVQAEAPPPVPTPDPVPEVQAIVYTPPVEPSTPAPREPKVLPQPRSRPEPQSTPTTVIKEAQRSAQVEPQQRGYFGQSAIQRWTWQPGRLYVVYVSPTQMTRIALPPGERLISKVFLDPEAWDVQSYRVGNEALTQDVVFLRPLSDKGPKEVDLALLTEQGHSFDLHLKVGPIGMVGVTWDSTAVPQVLLEDPTLRRAP